MGQTIGISQNSAVNGCIDTDGDGVPDVDDLDDDNDGILDSVECKAYTIYLREPVFSGNYSPNVPVVITGGNGPIAYTWNQTVAPADLTFAGVTWTKAVANVIPDATGKIDLFIALNSAVTSSYAGIDGILISDGSSFTAIDDPRLTYTGTWNVLNVGSVGLYNNTQYRADAPFAGQTATYSFTGLAAPCDTDGDNIPNSLDLDSDNDGCPDAIEGGGTFKVGNITPAGALTGTVSSATATYGVPTQAGTGQTIGTSQNAAAQDADCSQIDTDGDGVLDSVDLDDDNDGILDTAECVPTSLVTNGTFTGSLAGWTSSGGWVASSGAAINTTDNANKLSLKQTITGLNSTSTGSNVIVTMDATAFSVGNTAAYLEVFLGGTSYGLFSFVNGTLSGAATAGSGAVMSTFAPITVANNQAALAPAVSLTIPWVGKPNTADLDFQFSAATSDFYLDNVSIQNNTFCDTDGDGIPNSLDNDSDGDGCPDAVEGGSAFTIPSGQVNSTTGQLTGAVSTSAATNGVPVLAGTGQSVGISQNASVNECTDTDGDGIADVDDLDDDNDGILDTIECVPTSLVTNGDFTSNLTGWTSTGGWITSSGLALNNTDNVNKLSLKQTITGLNSTSTGGNVILKLDATVYNVNNSAAYIEVVLGGTLYGTYRFESNTFTFVPANGATAINTLTVAAGASSAAVMPGVQILIPWVGKPTTADLDFQFSAFQSDFYLDNVSIQNNVFCDTDGDGIANSLDLDSDGDGCPDAIEGAGAFNVGNITPVGALTGTVSSATATYGVPTQAGTGQAIGTSQNAAAQDADCPQTDSDGDGIPDSTDLDDDNDGILDTVEDPACEKIVNGSGQNNLAGWTATGNVVSNASPQIIFNFNETPATGVLSQTISTVPNQPLQVKFDAVGFGGNAAGSASIRVDVLTGSTVIATKTIVKTFGNPFTNETLSFLPTTNQTTIRFTDLSTVTTQFDFVISGVSVIGACGLDSDRDGIVNSLDLDSDGDGCPDAIEGGAVFTTANLVTSTMPGGNSGAGYNGTFTAPVTQNLGNTVTTMGVPVTAAIGQTIGTSQNGALNGRYRY